MDESIWPEYLDTQFVCAEAPAAWPAEFWIITACNPFSAGARDDDQAANGRLRAVLAGEGDWLVPLRGIAPTGGHGEDSFAVAGIPAGRILALGREFRQNAVFHVRGDELHVVSCQSAAEVPAGTFRARVRCR